MVAAIVAREILISGLRLAAMERGVVIAARDLGKLKTWAQAIAAALGRLRRRGRLGRQHRLVGAARRARAHLGLGARLRPRRAAPAARDGLTLYAERRYASNSATNASKVRPKVDANASCHSTPRAIASR